MYTLYKLQSGGIVQYSHFVKCGHRPIPALCSPTCVYTEKCSTAKSLVIFNNERLLSGGNVSMGFSSPQVTENRSKSRGEAE